MSQVDKPKTVITVALDSGTALGTSSIIDSSGYKALRAYGWTTATDNGSALLSVYGNFGTSTWSGTTCSDACFMGSCKPITGLPASVCVTGIPDRAFITKGTGAVSFAASWVLTDGDA